MFKSFCLWLKLCSSITGPAYVIDGDTIVVDRYHVRIAGVDAEELNEPNGLKAKAMMQYIIGGSNVTCELSGLRSHKRYVGTCKTQAFDDIGAKIIESGYALDCAHYSGGKYRKLEPPDARQRLIQKPYC